jgi:uncharacterized protein YgbK (DUF1537 family)
MWESVCILADDLTGLAETIQAIADPFSQKILGYKTTVHPLPVVAGCVSLEAFSISGFNTNHRACTVETTKANTLQWIKTFSQQSIASTFFYQKMDSTLRGWWAEEATQWVKSEKVELVWCCPAYPQQGRTTKNGSHFLHNTPLHETAMATDPTHPISTNELTTYLSKAGVSAEHILNITVSEIEGYSVEAWVERLQKSFQEKPFSWIVQDATTPEQLEKMATVVHQLKRKNGLPPTLFLGSGGWAGALAGGEAIAFEQNPEHCTYRGGLQTLPHTGDYPPRPQLVVSGSVNPTTLAQLAYLKESKNPTLPWVSIWEAEGGSLKSVETVLKDCLAVVVPNETLILTTCTSPKDRSGNASEQAFIQATLSAVLSQLFQAIKFDNVICCGGETSLLTLKAANAPLLQWYPQGKVVQFPPFESDSGCTWVFKSGNMGDEQALSQLLHAKTGHPLT